MRLYQTLFKRAIESMEELKRSKDKCLIDDQGIIGWMYGKENYPITLDFNSTLLATSATHRLKHYNFNTSNGMWEDKIASSIPSFIHFAGSKRAFRVYYQKIRMWHSNRLELLRSQYLHSTRAPLNSKKLIGKETIDIFLKKSTVKINGKETPYYDVCPDQQPFTWNKAIKNIITSLDDTLKKAGLSPQHRAPSDCPEEFCPPLKSFFRH